MDISLQHTNVKAQIFYSCKARGIERQVYLLQWTCFQEGVGCGKNICVLMSLDCSSHKDYTQELLSLNWKWLEKCPTVITVKWFIPIEHDLIV